MAINKIHKDENNHLSVKNVDLDVDNTLNNPNKLEGNISLLVEAYGNFEDGIIWSKFKTGDKSVFTYIYYKYFKMLCRYGSQFLADKDKIKDHIHDLFIELSDRRAKLSNTTSIKFYLMKSLKNRMLAARKRKNIFLPDNFLAQGYDFEISFSIEQTMIHDQELKERTQQLNIAIQKLSKRQREAVYYFYFEELSIEEISDLMDCGNAKSIQNLLYRAIHYLREYIA